MAIDIEKEKLLVLKAYYMGHKIAKKKDIMQAAIELIDKAIMYLKQRPSEKDTIRLLFYVLLKSEILRETSEVINLRKQAKEIADSIGGDVFCYYMKIEEATQTKSRICGIQKGIIDNEGIITVENNTVTDGYKELVVRYDVACRALDVDEHKLSDKEINFLHKITLKEMLRKHGII